MNPVSGKPGQSLLAGFQRVLWSGLQWKLMGEESRCAWLAGVARWDPDFSNSSAAVDSLLGLARRSDQSGGSDGIWSVAERALIGVLAGLRDDLADRVIAGLGPRLGSGLWGGAVGEVDLGLGKWGGAGVLLTIARRRNDVGSLALAVELLLELMRSDVAGDGGEQFSDEGLLREAGVLTSRLVGLVRDGDLRAGRPDLLALRRVWSAVLESRDRPETWVVRAAIESGVVAPMRRYEQGVSSDHRSDGSELSAVVRSAIRDRRSRRLCMLADAVRFLADSGACASAESRLFGVPIGSAGNTAPIGVAAEDDVVELREALRAARVLLLDPSRRTALRRSARTIGGKRGLPGSVLDSAEPGLLQRLDVCARFGRVAWWLSVPRLSGEREMGLSLQLTDPSPGVRHAIVRGVGAQPLLRGLAQDLCFDADERVSRSAAIVAGYGDSGRGKSCDGVARLARSSHRSVRRLVRRIPDPAAARRAMMTRAGVLDFGSSGGEMRASPACEHVRGLLASDDVRTVLEGLHLAPIAARSAREVAWRVERVASDVAGLCRCGNPVVQRQAMRTLGRVRWILHSRWRACGDSSADVSDAVGDVGTTGDARHVGGGRVGCDAMSAGMLAALLPAQTVWLDRGADPAEPVADSVWWMIAPSRWEPVEVGIVGVALLVSVVIGVLCVRRWRRWCRYSPGERAFRFGCSRFGLSRSDGERVRWLATVGGQEPMAVLLNPGCFADALVGALDHPLWEQQATGIARLRTKLGDRGGSTL